MHASFPQFLRPGIARDLNCNIYNSTGCFCFLNTDTLPLHHSTEAQGSFQALVTVLYCLYHDYGRGFLKTCLSKDLVPPSAASDPYFMEQRQRAEMHVLRVCKILRAGLCHGLFPYDQSRWELPKTLDEYCKGQLVNENDCWNDAVIKIQRYTQKNWSDAKARLTQESDSVYDYLCAWADSWGDENNAQKKQLMRKFFEASDHSFNMALVEPIMTIEYASCCNNNHCKQTQKTTLKNALAGFQRDIQKKFLSYAYRDPDEIYQELVELVKKFITPPRTSSIQKAEGTPFDVT